MDDLNYHHLRYFHAVATEGSVAAAAEKLFVAQPTISGQVKALERSIGEPLFRRVGRNLELTEIGHLVYGYAEEIFATGRELIDTLAGHGGTRGIRLRVGAGMVVPKLVVFRLLRPALDLPEPVELVCEEGSLPDLLARLSIHQLDIVLSDAPLGQEYNVRAFNHLLGESSMTLFAPAAQARRLRSRFPEALDGTPMLLPLAGTSVRRAVDAWLDAQGVSPRVIGQFADSALIKVFGQNGAGAFFAPTAIADEVSTQFHCRPVAEIDQISERYYAISIERRLKHPAVVAVSDRARNDLFA